MIEEHMYDLGIELLPNGAIRLEQSAGSLEDASVVELHPVQIRLVAERAGLLAPPSSPSLPRGFQVRLERLRSQSIDLLQLLASVPCVPSGTASEGVTMAERLVEDFHALIDDHVEQASVTQSHAQSRGRNDNSEAITVTRSDMPKRGRPASGEAMSNAQRQQRHREKQKHRHGDSSFDPELIE